MGQVSVTVIYTQTELSSLKVPPPHDQIAHWWLNHLWWAEARLTVWSSLQAVLTVNPVSTSLFTCSTFSKNNTTALFTWAALCPTISATASFRQCPIWRHASVTAWRGCRSPWQLPPPASQSLAETKNKNHNKDKLNLILLCQTHVVIKGAFDVRYQKQGLL